METRGGCRFAAAGNQEVDVSAWEGAFDRAGIPGLRGATLQFYRRAAGLDSVIPLRPQTITALGSENARETIIAPSTRAEI